MFTDSKHSDPRCYLARAAMRTCARRHVRGSQPREQRGRLRINSLRCNRIGLYALWHGCAAPRMLIAGVAPPERIDLGDIVVRRWAPGDLAARFEALTASYSSIHPWMEWLSEPATLEQQRAFGATVAVSWPDAEGGCNYGIFDRCGAVLGAIGIHDRIGAGALEIGYWCHIDYVGRGFITRSAAALTDIALSLPGVTRVEIHCDEANTRSAGVARRLGYRLDRVEPRPVRAPAESGWAMVWIKDSSGHLWMKSRLGITASARLCSVGHAGDGGCHDAITDPRPDRGARGTTGSRSPVRSGLAGARAQLAVPIRRTGCDRLRPGAAALVFVEVKTRTSDQFGGVAQAVSPQKVRRLRRLAGLWLAGQSRSWSQIRIDVLGVRIAPGTARRSPM